MAREVHLYSSGNIPVLQGWAYSSGLPNLTNLQQLEITIHPRNARQYETELKRKLADRCPRLQYKNINVIYDGFQATESSSHGKDQEKNVRCDKPTGTTDVLGSMEKPSIKVALLDSGAGVTSLDGEQKPTSFRSDKQDYFVGPCSHGTEMVRCIRAICPMAKLYIAGLDDSREVENQEFTTASAYKALQWAIGMDVDVISISWTFRRKGTCDDEYERKFVELIQNAVSRNKFILFGSLLDKGPTHETSDYAPVGLNAVIKIGSATIFGQQSKMNSYADPEFLLPGEELETPAGDLVSGSSFSTAYVPGLAALILYCLSAHKQLWPLYEKNSIPDSYDESAKLLTKAQTLDGMRKIFRNLGRDGGCDERKNRFFIRPYTILGETFGVSEEEKLKDMQGIVKSFRLSKNYGINSTICLDVYIARDKCGPQHFALLDN